MLSIRHARRVLQTPLTTTVLLAAVLLAAVPGCERTATPTVAVPGAGEPAEAVAQLAEDLRRNDLAAYARHALPPALHERMEAAWREERTIWPLTELPLDDRLPGFVTVLAAPGAEKTLLATYQRQFAGADRELHTAAATLGLFASQYVRSEGSYSDAERGHYLQLIDALSQWGRQAPLGDPQRAKTAIPQLVAAARLTGLAGPASDDLAAEFHRIGMTHSLQRLAPFFARLKQVLKGYGLDLDAALGSVEASVVEQSADRATVRLRYTLGAQPIDTVVQVERRDGRWYLSNLLRHAEAEAGEAAEPSETAIVAADELEPDEAAR